jgi:hypothetical protein
VNIINFFSRGFRLRTDAFQFGGDIMHEHPLFLLEQLLAQKHQENCSSRTAVISLPSTSIIDTISQLADTDSHASKSKYDGPDMVLSGASKVILYVAGRGLWSIANLKASIERTTAHFVGNLYWKGMFSLLLLLNFCD